MSALPSRVDVREVGPRDGLQAEAPIDFATRVALIELLLDTGVTHIEVVAFVSPRAVPAMAGAADVLGALPRRPGVVYAALVPNLRGAELALSAGVDELTVTVSASEAYSARNVRMSVEESIVAAADICAAAGSVPADVIVSCAFGSPYEGDIAPAEVAGLGRRLAEHGAARLTYADTTGMATPRGIDALVDLTGDDIGLHLHETRGTALVNAYTALLRGVRRFDTAIGGLGGSPFAAESGGNLGTEDLVHLLDDLGIESGIDLDRLLEVSREVPAIVGHDVPSPVARAGPRSKLAAE
jgi:hydroxymethylglutaryl-CoA lyase